MAIAVGSVIAGKYQIEARLARGGMGTVWAARHVKLGSPVAVKLLDPHYASSREYLERFEREARAAAMLQSPHVVHVQDYGVEGDAPYLVMELLQGEDLGRRLARERRLSLSDAGRIALHVGKALRRAHEAGIVHRDLKPANLFLTRVDDEEIVKILDFGIAKEVASVGESTRTGDIMGSPHYMSPEQARAERTVDHRADLWALGVILYRTVTGVLPFAGEALGAVISQILVEPVPRVVTVAPDLPSSLDFFFAKAMAKARENRFQSVYELVDAFVAITGGAGMPISGHTAPRASLVDIPGPARSSVPPGELRPSLAPSSAPPATFPPSLAPSSAPPATFPPPFAPSAPPPAMGATPLVPSTTPPAMSAPGLSGNTLATASIASAAAPRPQRSAVPWIVGGALLATLVGAGAFGFGIGRSPSSGVPATEPAPAAPPPASSSAAPQPTASADPAPPASSAPPATEPAPTAPPDPLAKPPAPTAAPTASSKRTAPAQTSYKPPPPPRPTAKPTGGWGF